MLLPPVILVNEKDEPVGTMEKLEAHQKGLLHRAFSVFVVNAKGDMLLQQRALSKYHSGGLWTNTCCSHPLPGENILAAAHRRLQEEMGFDCDLQEVFSFTYRAALDNGLTEHEFDHVFLGVYDGAIAPDTEEVLAHRFLPVSTIRHLLAEEPDTFTQWFHLAFPKIEEYLQKEGTAR